MLCYIFKFFYSIILFLSSPEITNKQFGGGEAKHTNKKKNRIKNVKTYYITKKTFSLTSQSLRIPRPSEQKKIHHKMYTSPQIRTKKKKEIHLLLFKKTQFDLECFVRF